MRIKLGYSALLYLHVAFCGLSAVAEDQTIKFGWIGPMSGPFAKYGAYQSALLAQDDINASGGIGGKKLEIIFEDGKGEGRSAATSVHKLLNVDRVHFIIGGHCTPESLAMAPIVAQSNAIMLAAITSNPKLTGAGDAIFRITAVGTTHADLEVSYAMEKLGLSSFAVVHEETDYAIPPAEHFAGLVRARHGKVTAIFPYHAGDTDFRTIVTKIAHQNPSAVYLGVQSPEAAVQFIKQLRAIRYVGPIFGNESTGNAVYLDEKSIELFEGVIFGEPEFALNSSPTKEFVERYNAKFETSGLPYGIWSAEAYDAVRLLAAVISRCGEQVDSVKQCLYATKNYSGVSGPITIDSNGDGLRNYQLKVVTKGAVKTIN